MTARRLYPHQTPVDNADLWTLLLAYVRYAMGRMSTAPSTARDMVRGYGHALTPEQRDQIADEIRRELLFCERNRQWLGGECDHRLWHETLAEIDGRDLAARHVERKAGRR